MSWVCQDLTWLDIRNLGTGSHSPHLAPGASLCPKVHGSQKVRASDMRGLAPKIQLGMIHKIGAGSVIVTNINKPK
jgi:hypothetical protein